MSKSKKRRGLPGVNDRAAGIDIGSRFHVAAVPPDLACILHVPAHPAEKLKFLMTIFVESTPPWKPLAASGR